MHRRELLKNGAVALTVAATKPLFAWQGANNRVRMAVIGMGNRSGRVFDSLTRFDDVQFTVGCEVAQNKQQNFQSANRPIAQSLTVVGDYRRVLDRNDIDAVLIGTPDHWHKQMTLDAVAAGKDVYVEKPMVHKIDQGLGMVETQRKTGRICQVGSQRVSSILYAKAKELLASGGIGPLNLVEAWWNRNSPQGAWQYTLPPDASPATVDWERFLGPAPRRPFDPVRLFR